MERVSERDGSREKERGEEGGKLISMTLSHNQKWSYPLIINRHSKRDS